MLRKPAAARPTLKRCLDVFSQPIKGPSDLTPAKNALAEAGRKVAEEQARAEAAEQAENSRILTRVQLQRDANEVLKALRKRLFEEIANDAESTQIERPDELILGAANVSFKISEHNFEPNQNEPWDIVAWSTLVLTVKYDTGSIYRWSASLVFGKPEPESDYRWHEVAFVHLSGRNNEPAAIDNVRELRNGLIALGFRSTNIAYGPFPIDAEDEESFLERWQALVARAAVAKLTRPNNFPIDFDMYFRSV